MRRWRKPGAALSVVQAKNNFTAAASATTVTISTAPGSLLVIFTQQGANSTSTVAITDSASQTWTQTASGYNSLLATRRSAMWVMPNSAAVTSVTATWSGSLSTTVDAIVFEISGAATSSVEDTSINNNNANGSTATSGTFSTANANDILIFGVNIAGAYTSPTAGAGYAIPTGGDAADRAVMEYKIVSATQTSVTATLTWTTNHTNANILGAFKAAAAASIFVVDSESEGNAPAQPSSSALFDTQEHSGRMPLPPRAIIEDGDFARSFDWRVSLHDDDYSGRAPLPAVASDAIALEHVPETFVNQMAQRELRDFTPILPPPVGVASVDNYPEQSLDWRVSLQEEAHSASLAPVPVFAQEDTEWLHRSLDARAVFDDGAEAQKLPPVIVIPTTSGDDVDSLFLSLEIRAAFFAEEQWSASAPAAPVSIQEDHDHSFFRDARNISDDGAEAQKLPPVIVIPTTSGDDLDSLFLSLEIRAAFFIEEPWSASAPAAPVSIQEDHDHSFFRDARAIFDDGAEAQKLPPVIVITPTASDEVFEARSWEWRVVLDDSTESSSVPAAPISMQEDYDFSFWRDVRAVFDDGAEAQKTPPPPPVILTADDIDLVFVDWLSSARLAAVLDEYDQRFFVALTGPFAASLGGAVTLQSLAVGRASTISTLATRWRATFLSLATSGALTVSGLSPRGSATLSSLAAARSMTIWKK